MGIYFASLKITDFNHLFRSRPVESKNGGISGKKLFPFNRTNSTRAFAF
jgi:hypothetical protein